MYAIIMIAFFVAAFISNDVNQFIGYMIISALFAIAAGISSIYVYISKDKDKNDDKK